MGKEGATLLLRVSDVRRLTGPLDCLKSYAASTALCERRQSPWR
jgi:hypothetical protein